MAITIEQQPEDLSASGNSMYFLVHTNQSNRINYKMTAQIHIIESDDSIIELPLMRLYPDNLGNADIDISKIIDNRLNPKFPTLEETGFVKLNGFTLKYKVVFTEEGNYVYINSTASDILTAMKGKFAINQSPMEWIRQNDFLTNCQNFETVANSIHYLVVLFIDPGYYRPCVEFTYTDNTIDRQTIDTIHTTQKYEMYAIPTGMKQLNKVNLRKYSFWISGGVMQEKRVVYNVVRITKKHKPIIYLNRIGGIDHMIVSEMSDLLKTTKEYYQKDDYSAIAVITDYSEIFEVTTGYITREGASLSKELLLSNVVYTIADETLVPINIEKGTFELYSAYDDLQSFSFKYTFVDLNYHSLSSGSENPLPENITVCCPDGIDDYFTTSSISLSDMMGIFPTNNGQKIVYTINMIPGEGSVFSWGLMTGMYIEFFYTGTVYGIVCLFKGHKYLYYAESLVINMGKRVNVELSINNDNDSLFFELKINSISEQLSLLNIDISNSKNFMYLFKSTEQVVFGCCKLINFNIDKIINAVTTSVVKWDFLGSTSAEKLQNKAEGGSSNYNLVAKNIENVDNIIKTISI